MQEKIIAEEMLAMAMQTFLGTHTHNMAHKSMRINLVPNFFIARDFWFTHRWKFYFDWSVGFPEPIFIFIAF